MKKGLLITVFATIIFTTVLILVKPTNEKLKKQREEGLEEIANEDPAMRALFTEQRAQYEFDMLKNPVSGIIPDGVYEAEMREAIQAKVKGSPDIASGNITMAGADNIWQAAGPNNIGGRTRAVAFDVRYNGTTNKVIIAGCVSGGIMRSTDGGETWTRVNPDQSIHNIVSLAQDPRVGFQDTWYAGTGEASGNSASGSGATFFGHGIFKSINNGATWTALSSTQAGSLTSFDNVFDFVFKIAVNPANGDVYAATQQSIMRSTNGGSSWSTVRGSLGGTTANGWTDVVINNAGTRIYTAFHMGNTANRGVFVSTTGDAGSWITLAGATNDNPTGWIAIDGSSRGRVVLALAPSNQNTLYVLYDNGKSQAGGAGVPECDLWKANVTDINAPIWTNLSANMPNLPTKLTGSNPIAIQGGYDLALAVRPTDENFVLIGGTNLYASSNGFTNTSATNWVGGYTTALNYANYPNSHADIHTVAFDPSNPKRAICGNDGGVQITEDITLPSPVWRMMPNYQTLQYYYVALDPETGKNNFIGGAQDNGTWYRDATLVLGARPPERPGINDHEDVFGGDGVSVDIARINGSNQFYYCGSQTGNILRDDILNYFTSITTNIRPPDAELVANGTGFGEFVTQFKLSNANSEILFYVSRNRLFRTNAASTVTRSMGGLNGWTRLNGVENTIGSTSINIRSMDFSWGPYLSTHAMYLGTTSGRVYRLDNYANADGTSIPIDITPASMASNTTVQDIAVNPNNDNEIMIVVSNYGVESVWWTNNAKSAAPTWVSVEGNLASPSIRSCVILVKKDAANNPVTEYYIGTSVGLYSVVNLSALVASSASINWQREGAALLNFSLITSMDYRPEDNTMLIGTHGNGMYFANIGNPNFTPNPTALAVIRNDNNFIRNLYPTIGKTNLQYQTGTITGIRKIDIRILNPYGQVVYQTRKDFTNGTIPMPALPSGMYIVEFISDNKKYHAVQKIIRQ